MKKSELRKLIRTLILENITEDIGEDAKQEITALLKSYKGSEVPDAKVHAVADKYKISPHDVESFIYGLASSHLNEFEDSVSGGKGDKTDPKSVCPKELAVGIKVEREHTDSDEKAEEISIDHLTENPKYYSELVASGIVDEKEALDLAKKLGIGQSVNEASDKYSVYNKKTHDIIRTNLTRQAAMKLAKTRKDYHFGSAAWVEDNYREKHVHESAIGDMYIELGESIEDLDRSLHKVKDMCKKMRYTKAVPTLNKLKHDVLDLKKMFGDSYDFL